MQAKLNRELVAHEDDPEAILEMVRTHAPDMNAVNCATALHRYGTYINEEVWYV